MADLDIENYSFEELLRLFELRNDFNEYDLKNAKKIVLRLHPDKSGLPSEYFLFYSKAYKLIFHIWEFKNKSENKSYDGLWNVEDKKTIMDGDMKDSIVDKNTILTNKLEKMNVNEFNNWFNGEFEKCKIKRDNEDGYDEWLKSDKDVTQISDLNQTNNIELHKKRVKEMIVYDGVHELHSCASGYSELNSEKPNEFNSEPFSSLSYQDLYTAHAIPVLPVSETDYVEQDYRKSIDSYKKYSDNQIEKSHKNQKGEEYLYDQYKKDETMGSELAYKLAKEVEESERKNSLFWSKLMTLK
jgi:hypothetical protein